MKRNIFVLIYVFAIVTLVNTKPKFRRSLRSVRTCGVSKLSSGLVVRGQNFSRGDFPWIVALMLTRTEVPSFFCGGTLISSTFVISAAHCINGKNSYETLLPRDILAIFGAHNLSNFFEPAKVAFSPTEIYIHDKWNPRTTEYHGDLSLLEFEAGTIHFNDYVQPICFLDSDTDQTEGEGIVTGWGQSEDPSKVHEDVPKLIKVLIQTNEECLPGKPKLARISSNRTFCAGLKNGSGICHGDSGGGLFIKVDGIYYLKGIVSSSLITGNDCDVLSNAIYTNVGKFKDWIKKITGGALVSSTPRQLTTSTQRVTSSVRSTTADQPSTTNQRSILTGASKEVFCTLKIEPSWLRRRTKKCIVNQAIDSESYVFESKFDATIELFNISANREVKFLPRGIGIKLPNLQFLWAHGCGLTILRDYFFENMENVRFLNLYDNRIVTIESKTFEDLIGLEQLELGDNMIETLDEKIFATMVNLEDIWLYNNSIKFLSSETFDILGGKLSAVSLNRNVCIDGYYNLGYEERHKELYFDLSVNCTRHDIVPGLYDPLNYSPHIYQPEYIHSQFIRK